MTVNHHGRVIRCLRVFTLFTIVFSFCLPITLSAQTDRGSWNIGGRISYRMQRTPSSQRALYIFSKIGYFPIKNLVLGIKPGLNITNVNNSRQIRARYYALQGFGQYFIGGNATTIKPFVMASYGIGTTKVRENNMVRFRRDENTFEAAVGVAWFIAPSIAIENSIGYRESTSWLDAAPSNTTTIRQWGLNVGINFFL